MPPDTGRTGSFGASVPGGVDAIKAALQRRGLGGNVPLAGQVSGEAPGGLPGTPAGSPQPIPQAPAPPTAPNIVPTAPRAPATPPTPRLAQGETEIILRAMSQRLSSISKQEESQSRTAGLTPPVPQVTGGFI